MTALNYLARNKAFELMRKVIDLRSKLIDLDHSDTLDSISRLKAWRVIELSSTPESTAIATAKLLTTTQKRPDAAVTQSA